MYLLIFFFTATHKAEAGVSGFRASECLAAVCNIKVQLYQGEKPSIPISAGAGYNECVVLAKRKLRSWSAFAERVTVETFCSITELFSVCFGFGGRPVQTEIKSLERAPEGDHSRNVSFIRNGVYSFTEDNPQTNISPAKKKKEMLFDKHVSSTSIKSSESTKWTLRSNENLGKDENEKRKRTLCSEKNQISFPT